MLSYQHSFHAGNHADVLKHLTLVAVLERLNIKAKPYFYLDTHAGEGVYNLKSTQAMMNSEADSGITQLRSWLNDVSDEVSRSSELIQTYLTIVDSYSQNEQYPGSPLVASALLRRGDKGFAAELHPQAFESLQQNTRRSNIKAQHRDGFDMLNAMLPPNPNRGAVLIDPPYESKSEYQEVVNALSKAVKRWPIGIYMIWYPLLSETRIDRTTNDIVDNPKAALTDKMLEQLSLLNVKSVLNVQFCSEVPSEKVGMYGSGLCILNPPWQLDDDLKAITETLMQSITKDNNNLSKVEWLKTE